MQRWNGWGYPSVSMDLPHQAHALLCDAIGEGVPQDDYPLADLIQKISTSHIPHHPLISLDPEKRIRHAHGHSLPDWVALRRGTLTRVPDGVAFPDTIEDINELLRLARQHRFVVIPYGGGTSVLGQLTVPDVKRPVLSVSLHHLNRLVDLDTRSMLATFETGVKGPDLEAQLRAHNFTLGHYPQSFEFSTLGGWVATRACGQESTYYGRMDELFAGANLLTPRGPLTLHPYPASAAGPDLRHLVLGSEGRMGIITTATVKISPLPEKSVIYGIFFPSWEGGVEAVRELAGSHLPLSMMRLSNPRETRTNLKMAGRETQMSFLNRYLQLRKISADSACMCLIGFIGSRRVVAAARRDADVVINKNHGVSIGRTMGEIWRKNRLRTPYLRNSLWNLGYAVDTVETAVTWNRTTSLMQAVETALSDGLTSLNERVHVFSHLSSSYPTGSNVYTTFIFRLADTPEEIYYRWKILKEEASIAIVKSGGTISHQHGVGIDHKPYLEHDKGQLGIEALRHIFSFIDPDDRMNPTKMV